MIEKTLPDSLPPAGLLAPGFSQFPAGPSRARYLAGPGADMKTIARGFKRLDTPTETTPP